MKNGNIIKLNKNQLFYSIFILLKCMLASNSSSNSYNNKREVIKMHFKDKDLDLLVKDYDLLNIKFFKTPAKVMNDAENENEIENDGYDFKFFESGLFFTASKVYSKKIWNGYKCTAEGSIFTIDDYENCVESLDFFSYLYPSTLNEICFQNRISMLILEIEDLKYLEAVIKGLESYSRLLATDVQRHYISNVLKCICNKIGIPYHVSTNILYLGENSYIENYDELLTDKIAISSSFLEALYKKGYLETTMKLTSCLSSNASHIDDVASDSKEYHLMLLKRIFKIKAMKNICEIFLDEDFCLEKNLELVTFLFSEEWKQLYDEISSLEQKLFK